MTRSAPPVEQFVEQLLGTGPKFSSFAFILAFDRAGTPNLFCTTVVWAMLMEDFNVMFSGGKSYYKNRKRMAIEP